MPDIALRSGDRVGPYELDLGSKLVREFAEATCDDNRQVQCGDLVPPGLVATQSYRAQFAAIKTLVPEEVFSTARSGVHGQHDLVVYRPLSSTETLHTFVDSHSARPSGDNLRVTLHHATFDNRDLLVAEQWWSTVLLGITAEPSGPELPDYSFSSEGGAVVAEDVVRIDEVMARRYAQVSADYSDHHFTVEGASAAALRLHFFMDFVRWHYAFAPQPRQWPAVTHGESAE